MQRSPARRKSPTTNTKCPVACTVVSFHFAYSILASVASRELLSPFPCRAASALPALLLRGGVSVVRRGRGTRGAGRSQRPFRPARLRQAGNGETKGRESRRNAILSRAPHAILASFSRRSPPSPPGPSVARGHPQWASSAGGLRCLCAPSGWRRSRECGLCSIRRFPRWGRAVGVPWSRWAGLQPPELRSPGLVHPGPSLAGCCCSRSGAAATAARLLAMAATSE